jgi:hypothetical protein
MGTSQRTAHRDLKALAHLGWIDTESVRRQFGKIGRRYYPAVPSINEPSIADSMPAGNEPTHEAHSARNEPRRSPNEPKPLPNEPNGRGIEPPSVAMKSLSEISTEKSESQVTQSAASPLPADAGSAAQELREQIKREQRQRFGCELPETHQGQQPKPGDAREGEEPAQTRAPTKQRRHARPRSR